MRAPVTATISIMLLLTLLLQGCGHKGPLYLPAPQPEQQPVQPAPGK